MFLQRTIALPSKESVDVLVEGFNDFFIEKIHTIKETLHASRTQQTLDSTSALCTQNPSVSIAQGLSDFHLFDDLSVQSIIKYSSKSCPLDPLPTHIVKESLSSLSFVITKIVRASLSNGEFPPALKLSYVRPHLKKPDLDKELYQNYRPVANIPFLSKIIEKTVSGKPSL
jgi:hypothetical protein